MCPFCVTTATLTVAGTGSGVAIAAVIVKQRRRLGRWFRRLRAPGH